MRYTAENIKIPIDKLVRTNPREAVIRTLRIQENDVKNFEITRCSLDSRFHKSTGIYYVYHVAFDYPKRIAHPKVKLVETEENTIRIPENLQESNPTRVVVVGSGPSGLFASLRMIEYGLKPLILERGKDMEDRIFDVKNFWENRALNPESNIQFGIGGAGTFSDGKLRSRIKNPLTRYVVERFVEFGAERGILYNAKPHIGTDRLRKIITDIKHYIEMNGGEFRFESKVTDLIIADKKVRSVIINGREEIVCDNVILAIGNGARDTFEMLMQRDVGMTAKAFAVGVRIEHPQQIINRYTYGTYDGHPMLPNAEYQLTFRDNESDRSVYSFCNCPGGYVVNASSEPDRIAINGMSFSKRNGTNANSALVVNVTAEDFDDDSVLGGIEFQRKIEASAYKLGGADYNVPVMSVGDFIGSSVLSSPKPTVKPGYKETDITRCLPEFVSLSLQNAIIAFSKQIEGFEEGILSAPETRTSSPVRIIRNTSTMESVNVSGLYPVGEGAGYAGGIISSAVDGIKAVDRMLQKNA